MTQEKLKEGEETPTVEEKEESRLMDVDLVTISSLEESLSSDSDNVV